MNEIGTLFMLKLLQSSTRSATSYLPRLISTSVVVMAEGSEEKDKSKKQSKLSSFWSSATNPKTKPPKVEEKVADDGSSVDKDDQSGDSPKVPKLQKHTSDSTTSRDSDKETAPPPQLKKHQTDMGPRPQDKRESPSEGYVMRTLKIQQRAQEYISMPREDKRKLYKCGKKYTTLENIPTLKEDIESGDLKQKKAFEEGNDPELCSKVSLWRGDITRLESDAIVNAANSSLLGGGGVDGAIHSAAGLMLREECATLGGCSAGDAKISAGYKLPATYVIHTVGPMMERPEVLQSCYVRSFELVKEKGIRSVAFPCIATGIYGFPNEKAAHVALTATRKWLEENKDEVDRIVFCVFLDKDRKIYSDLMPRYFPTASPPPQPPKGRKEEEEENVGEQARMTTRTDSWEDECEEMDQGGPPPKSDEGADAGDEENTPDKEDSNQQNLEQIELSGEKDGEKDGVLG